MERLLLLVCSTGDGSNVRLSESMNTYEQGIDSLQWIA